jgi:epoxyqueuosine reductase
MSAAEIAAMDREALRTLAAGTPMARAGADGLLRNAALALAGDPEARPTLLRLAEDPHPLVSEAARWALER